MSKKQDISDLQRRILKVFTLIDTICEENNLTYFAISGTTLGAVRHKGFIPWDDDLDIAMPADDMHKLMDIVRHRYADTLGVHLQESNAFVCKIFDKRTTQVSESDFNLKDYTGVFIDIMPLFSIPNGTISRWFFWQKIRTLMRINNVIEKPYNRNKLKKVVYWFTRILSKDFFIATYRAELHKRNFYDERFTHSARTWGAGKNRSKKAFILYDKNMLGEGIKLKFEDTEIRCPADYETYLKDTYGDDFMSLPPEERRVSAHSRILDLEHSYRYHIAKEQGKIIGYTAGCYDMFHVGHLNLLERAKQHCDYLIVGVNSDENMYSYKKKYPIVPEDERARVIQSLSFVDEICIEETTDKEDAYQRHKYDIVFMGSDHEGEPRWDELKKKFNVKVKFFEYTMHTSSTKLRSALDDIIEDKKTASKKK